MKLQCLASIRLATEGPVAGISGFVAALRTSALVTDGASLQLTLVGTSARAAAALHEFRPERAMAVPFAQGLDVVEEVARLAPAKLRSLRVIATAKDFRWQGAPPDSSARLILLDGGSGRRKPRFRLEAQLQLR